MVNHENHLDRFCRWNLKDIFDYYAVNVSKKIAHQIRENFFDSTKQLIHNPESGPVELQLEELKQNYRYLICGNYKLIYKKDADYIVIYDIFDVRQDPAKMINKKRKTE